MKSKKAFIASWPLFFVSIIVFVFVAAAVYIIFTIIPLNQNKTVFESHTSAISDNYAFINFQRSYAAPSDLIGVYNLQKDYAITGADLIAIDILSKNQQQKSEIALSLQKTSGKFKEGMSQTADDYLKGLKINNIG